jgi:hypothetical protein
MLPWDFPMKDEEIKRSLYNWHTDAYAGRIAPWTYIGITEKELEDYLTKEKHYESQEQKS